MGEGFLNGIKTGALAGVSTSVLNIAAMGAAYKPDKEYGDFGDNGPV